MGVRLRRVEHVVLPDADEQIARRDVFDAVRGRDHPLPGEQRGAALVPELAVLVLPQADLNSVDLTNLSGIMWMELKICRG